MKKPEDARWSCVPTRRGLPRPWIRGGGQASFVIKTAKPDHWTGS